MERWMFELCIYLINNNVFYKGSFAKFNLWRDIPTFVKTLDRGSVSYMVFSIFCIFFQIYFFPVKTAKELQMSARQKHIMREIKKMNEAVGDLESGEGRLKRLGDVRTFVDEKVSACVLTLL